MPDRKNSRKEREKQRKREEILIAAESCFAKKGYHECTMEDIAREYQCAVGSLYNFFKGKDQIYKDIFAMHADKNIVFRDSISLIHDDPLQAISDYILARLEFGYQNKEFLRMFLRNKMNDNFADESLWYEVIWPTIQSIRQALKLLLENAISKGAVKDDLNIPYVQRMIEYQIYRVLDEICLSFCPDKPAEMSLVEHRDLIIDILFNGILKE